ncbi:MAG: MBL fold metallo-hydrolase [Bacteroidetes bacterium]|nr:MAG: MBL fold metallo-hydrolase [Bacteroidota bacterium]
MTLKILGSGTSQGVPVIGCKCAVCTSVDAKDQRLRSSAILQSAATTVLIDSGPDMRYQLLRAGIDDIDAVLITHQHQDHTAGLDDLRAINFIQKHSIPIYCSEAVEARIREQYSYIFQNSDYPGIPRINFKRIPSDSFLIGDIRVQPLFLWHADLPVVCFRVGDCAYITDANNIPNSELKKLQGLQNLVINALRKEKHHSHFSLEEALTLADDLGVTNCYFTHISHQMGMHATVQEELKQNRFLAWDGLELPINI